MKIALAQMNPVTGDLDGNVKKIIEYIAQAKTKGAELVIFPEMAITGYCISDLVEDKGFVEANKEALKELAKYSNGVANIIGFIDYDPDKKNEDGRMRKYNAAAVLQNGEIKGIVHKALLPNYRYFDDKRYFTAGDERHTIPITIAGKTLDLGLAICEDMWDDDYKAKPMKELADLGAEILVNINASPFLPGKRLKREELIKRHIAYAKKPFIYLNTVGSADNGKNIIPFDGQSMAFDRNGNMIAIGKQFEEELVLFDLDLEGRVAKLAKAPDVQREKEIYEALVMSIKDYAAKSGFKKLIEPVSGGIDSALGLAICVDAVGKDNVMAFNLPSKYNTDTTKGIAAELARNLGVEYRTIPIQKVDDVLKAEFEANNHPIKNKVAKENIHARIRGLLMMLESNDAGALLISNGNKTEVALGYSTLYGDMCGGISVIGDLSKRDVYALSRHVNKRHGRTIIPEATFTIKPSAELSEGQYDPFDYDVVAPLVDEFVEQRRMPKEIIRLFKERKLDAVKFAPDNEGKTIYDKHTEQTFAELAQKTYVQIKNAVYKRLQGPPIIAVTERAFGFDLRETLINRWRGQ